MAELNYKLIDGVPYVRAEDIVDMIDGNPRYEGMTADMVSTWMKRLMARHPIPTQKEKSWFSRLFS